MNNQLIEMTADQALNGREVSGGMRVKDRGIR